jgi:hypothetical protein
MLKRDAHVETSPKQVISDREDHDDNNNRAKNTINEDEYLRPVIMKV